MFLKLPPADTLLRDYLHFDHEKVAKKKSSNIGFDGLASVTVAIVKSDKEASFYFVPITPILLLLSF